MEKVFQWRSSGIHYRVFGSGKTIMVAFHGYGQSGSVFEAFSDALGEHYTIYAIDLPYHGNTDWNETTELSQDDLQDLIVRFQKEIGTDGPVAIMGYSIGGNYVLGITQKCPDVVKEIWLIAADGLRPKPGFYFLTKTILGKLLFKGFIAFPQPIFWAMKMGVSLGLIPDRVQRFFASNINTKEKRQALYRRWRSVSNIRGNLKKIKATIDKEKIPTRLLFGRNDGVIAYRFAVRFAEGVDSISVILTDQGHQMVSEETNPYLKNLLPS